MTLRNVSVETVPSSFAVTIPGGGQFLGTEFKLQPDSRQPLYVAQLSLSMVTENKGISINIHRKAFDDDILFLAVTTAANVLITESSGILLSPGDYISIVSTSATAEMRALLSLRVKTGNY